MFISTQRLRSLLFAAALAVPVTAAAQAGSGFDPHIAISSDPDTVVLSYRETPDMLAAPDTVPLIRVYASGRVVVHYPHYTKKSGDYETTLNRGQVLQLLREATQVVGLDQAALNHAKGRAQQARLDAGESFPVRSDTVAQTFGFDLAEFAEDANSPPRALREQVTWRDIEFDAETYPGVPEFQRLFHAQERVRELLDDPGLRRR